MTDYEMPDGVNGERVKLDKIGIWSEIKHRIIKDYAAEYSKILTAQQRMHIIREHFYIDAFSGAGLHESKTKDILVPGSPLYALETVPPFSHFFFIDLDEKRTSFLADLVGQREDVTIYTADCNQMLADEVFPRVQWKDRRRALCLLDPKGLHLDWSVVLTAGKMRSIEIFLNFPIMDINRNLVRNDPRSIHDSDKRRMDRFWGDRSWYDLLYMGDPDLFDDTRESRVASADPALVEAYRMRLRDIAGFDFVPEPILMSNTDGGNLYYLFFASPNDTGRRIVQHIFDKYRTAGKVA